MSEDSPYSIQRCPHDFENPYAQINRNCLRNKKIPFRARGLLAYLLTFDPSWKFSLPWIARDQEITENLANVIFKELIESGHAQRECYNDSKGQRRWRIWISEFPKFKKCSPDPTLPGPAQPDTANSGTKKEQENPYQDSLKKEEQIYKNRSQQVAPVSAEAESLYKFFFELLKKHHPHLKEPAKKKWIEELDRMLRIDKRNPQEVKEAILWLPNDLWFKANILCAKSLRKSYDKIVAKKNMSAEKELINLNRRTAQKFKEDYPEQVKCLGFNDRFVSNHKLCKDVPFNLPHETFKSALASLFGGRYAG